MKKFKKYIVSSGIAAVCILSTAVQANMAQVALSLAKHPTAIMIGAGVAARVASGFAQKEADKYTWAGRRVEEGNPDLQEQRRRRYESAADLQIRKAYYTSKASTCSGLSFLLYSAGVQYALMSHLVKTGHMPKLSGRTALMAGVNGLAGLGWSALWSIPYVAWSALAQIKNIDDVLPGTPNEARRFFVQHINRAKWLKSQITGEEFEPLAENDEERIRQACEAGFMNPARGVLHQGAGITAREASKEAFKAGCMAALGVQWSLLSLMYPICS